MLKCRLPWTPPMPIRKLPDSIIARIAAGEVITSPSNVIKELLENSLDAGATSVTVNISSTLESLSVRDNGPGIERGDLEHLCLNHYTSKVSCIEDLKRCGAIKALGSFGFRGEALHSISLCSHLRVTTKSNKPGMEEAGTCEQHGKHMDGLGYLAIYRGQDLLEIKEVACEEPGTLVEVNNIFYNNHVRAEHFFKNKSELSNCLDLLKSYGCIFPGIEGKIDNRSVLEGDDLPKSILGCTDSTALNNRVEYIARNFIDGQDVTRNTPGIDIEGWSRACIFTKKSPRYVIIATNSRVSLKSFKFILFVNGRLVRNNSLRAKVLQKYKSARGHGKRPNPFVFIEMFLEYVDVNVHPSKSEVLVGEDDIFDSILTDIESSLQTQDSCIQPELGTDTKQHKLDTFTSAPAAFYSRTSSEAIGSQDHNGPQYACENDINSGCSFGEPGYTAHQGDCSIITGARMNNTVPKSSLIACNLSFQAPSTNPYKVYSSPALRSLDDAVAPNKPKPKRFSLISLGELQQEIVEIDSHFFRTLSFVGCFTRNTPDEELLGRNCDAYGYIFAQHQVNLIRIECGGFLFNAFYQKVIRDFGNFECREISKPVKADIDEDLWDLLREYFGLHISEGYVIGAPVIYGTVCEDFAQVRISKSTEKETLKVVSQEIAKCYSSCSRLSVDNKLFNRIKVEIIGTRELLDCCALMTDLKELYKGFDRC